MVWKQMLILKLLSEMIGPDLAREKYGFPLFDEQEKICHYFGMVIKHRNSWHVRNMNSQTMSMVRVTNETKVQKQLDFAQEVHIFAKEDGETHVALLVVSAAVYDMARMVEKTEHKFQLLEEILQLRADRRKVVYQLFNEAAYRRAMLHFCGFSASNRLENDYGCSEHIQMLVEEFNNNFSRKLKLQRIDCYQAETLLADLVGGEFYLTPNSVTPNFSYHHLLAAYAMVKRCSVWDFAYRNTAQVILNKREQSFIPVHYITVLISTSETEKLIRDLIKQGKGLKKCKSDYYLVHILRNRKDLSVSTLESVAKFLFSEGIQEHHLRDLPYLAENPTVYDYFVEYIRHVFGEEYERIVNDLVGT